ncbi:MAG: DNA gyrase subunit A [Planctomycetaceae bacterium]|nr:DNA gyrase subunit A [Planctomycetaceae bacterium]
MSDTDFPSDLPIDDSAPEAGGSSPENDIGTKLIRLSVSDEMRNSYLTYAMSVIVSRAIPDVRDGLKPSQRRILVAMNDIPLTPGAKRAKCSKISGDTIGNYHPHGDQAVYATLVRMAQEWNTRYLLVDKQGNFGSIAGLPAAAHRYTEARMSTVAAMMLDDLNLDTVDFIPTYDDARTEPTVLPSKFPNLLANGSQGIAVGMATSIPPHNVAEVCDAAIAVLDNPGISPFELLNICPGPDFPTGGVICGSSGIRRAYLQGRGKIILRARARIEETGKRSRIVISEIPYQKTRDEIEIKINEVAEEGKITGISAIRNESDLKEPVRLILELKKDADPHVVLNQLYEFTPLQDTFSIILLALVDGKPRILTFKELLEKFIGHRQTVIRRRTQFLLAKARKRKHTVEGLIIAHADIDEVIRTIRTSKTQPEAKQRLMQIQCPSSMLHRALGDEGFGVFQSERGQQENYTLTPIQADAILRMTLGHLVNLEQDKLGAEYRNLLEEIKEYNRILSDENIIRDMIRDDLRQVKAKHGDKRRTEISGVEFEAVDYENLMEEETMVVSITQSGYIKRTPAAVYQSQKRGGKGRIGARTTDEEDEIQHLFVTTTHNYLMFFTNKGKCYWQKVYELPEAGAASKGRSIANVLHLAEGEKVSECLAVKDFLQDEHYLVFATKKGLIKKTELSAYSRPKKGGLIAVNLREDDELVDTLIVGPGDEIIISTANGQAIRFRHTDVRSMGRGATGVKGVKLKTGDCVAGIVVAKPEMTLLTATENGFGKRTLIGANAPVIAGDANRIEDEDSDNAADTPEVDVPEPDAPEEDEKSAATYPTKRRGGMGVKDIKTTPRNGKVIAVAMVDNDDEVLMITEQGMIQRIRMSDVSVIGRNTQGNRLMKLKEGDKLAALKKIPKDENGVKE